jgi:hypothetical protein
VALACLLEHHTASDRPPEQREFHCTAAATETAAVLPTAALQGSSSLFHSFALKKKGLVRIT